MASELEEKITRLADKMSRCTGMLTEKVNREQMCIRCADIAVEHYEEETTMLKNRIIALEAGLAACTRAAESALNNKPAPPY